MHTCMETTGSANSVLLFRVIHPRFCPSRTSGNERHPLSLHDNIKGLAVRALRTIRHVMVGDHDVI